jgi:hypothetical protein
MLAARNAQIAVCKSLIAASIEIIAISSSVSLGAGILRFEYLCLGLEPVVRRESVNPAALLVQLEGALTDSLFDVVRKVRLS